MSEAPRPRAAKPEAPWIGRLVAKLEAGPDGTIREALCHTERARWRGMRTHRSTSTQARLAVETLWGRGLRNLEDVSPDDLQAAKELWVAQGLAPSTINKRLNCLSAMGLSVKGCRARNPKRLKWWLRPEDEAAARAFLATRRGSGAKVLATFIPWTTRTGLRLEESLRLTKQSFTVHPVLDPATGIIRRSISVTVPGLKTATAEATLPLSDDAAAIAFSLLKGLRQPTDRLFPVTYGTLRATWEPVREHLGALDNPTATLKALRRSAARHLHARRGMPLDMVRHYLRHENVQTTMSYLRLTGGYGEDEMRRWLA